MVSATPSTKPLGDEALIAFLLPGWLLQPSINLFRAAFRPVHRPYTLSQFKNPNQYRVERQHKNGLVGKNHKREHSHPSSAAKRSKCLFNTQVQTPGWLKGRWNIYTTYFLPSQWKLLLLNLKCHKPHLIHPLTDAFYFALLKYFGCST